MQVATRHFVRPEFMNHHHSLYAGYISEWMTEAGFIGAAAVFGRTEQFVLAAIKDIQVTKPIYSGSVLELDYEVQKVGTTSVEIQIQGVDFLSREKHCEGSVVFVTIDEDGHKKPHGLSWSDIE